jgi:Peptidase family M23
MSTPNLTVTMEPFESGTVVCGPLAARTSADDPNAQLSLVLRITNNEVAAVHVNTVTISFTPPPVVNTSAIPVDLPIDPGQSTTWYFATANNIILPLPAPSAVTVGLICNGFGNPATVTKSLAPYQSPVVGGYLFPAKLSELHQGEFWHGRSAVHSPAGGGVQVFAYDMDVQVFDTVSGHWTALVPGGSSSKNEDYRIWGKSVVAMADGTVQSWANDQPTNPNPPADLSPPNPVEGNHFYIQHATDLVLYAHMQPGSLNPQLLSNGAPVKAGDFLGLAGNSGNSSGPHLHIHAIKATQPWQGPPRPILFQDIFVIDRTVLNLPDPSGPWVNVKEQGLPSVDSAIWPASTPPFQVTFRPSHYLAIDPLALVLSSQTYVRLTLPDPPPIDVWTRQVREVVMSMTFEERKATLARVRTLGVRLKALEGQLEG